MIQDRIAALDTHLFASVESQTSDDDRKSLLALHNCMAAAGKFSYLEIGSHLGGTLQAVLADPRCARVVSIDSRPQWQPDDRPYLNGWEYRDNSTERMLELLQKVPDVDLSKLETVEESTEKIAPGRFARPDFCFIDGEHTHDAALRDARFCRAVMQGAGIIAFHDFGAIERAVLAFVREVSRPHRAYPLRSSIFVVELGSRPTLLTDVNVRGQLSRPPLWISANRVAADTAVLAASIRRREMTERSAPRDQTRVKG